MYAAKLYINKIKDSVQVQRYNQGSRIINETPQAKIKICNVLKSYKKIRCLNYGW